MATLSPMPASPVPAGQRPHPERARTLDSWKSITFLGKLFYLDLPHNKQTQLLTKAICRLGGVIEGFLSRDVNYVVTGRRKAADIGNGDSGNKREGRWQRKTAENMEPTPCSRGKQLLKKVVQSQECSSVLTSARSWGVCIIHVDEVLEFLELPTHRRTNKTPEEKGSGCIIKVGKLKSPFLKIEDKSRKFRPLQCCFSSFPELTFVSSDRSPFETARTNNSTPKERDPGEQEDDEVERSKRPDAMERSGYCECCQVTFAKLSEHLISEQHSLFALDSANYRVIDDITCHIICDLVTLPYEFKPAAERCVGADPCSIGNPSLSGAKQHVEQEAHKLDVPKSQPVEICAARPAEEDKLQKLPVEKDAAHPVEEHDLGLPEELLMETGAVYPVEEKELCLPEKLPVENNDVGPPFAEATGNTQDQIEVPLPTDCEAGGGSHVGLFTEVSWYTEETGLTSVYTVQSVVIPPADVLNEHTELPMKDSPGPLPPQLFLDTLVEPLSALVSDGFAESHNEPTQWDAIPAAHTEPQMFNSAVHHCTELLVNETPLVTAGELCDRLFAVSPCGEVCTLPLLDIAAQRPVGDTASGELPQTPLVGSAIELHQQLLLACVQNEPLLNAPCELPTEPSHSLALDQLKLAPCHPTPAGNEMVTPNSAPLGNLTDPQEQDQPLANADWFGGKRKHCWSPCHPPAKRQPFQCQPAPMWAIHQLPSSGHWPAVPVFTDRVGKGRHDTAAESAATVPSLCFNPKLVQYNASSESDWDFQLLSQQQHNPQQSAHYGDLRTAQVNLDESCYGKQLCSVLADDQPLGSPTTIQTVTLSPTSYDLCLRGVAS